MLDPDLFVLKKAALTAMRELHQIALCFGVVHIPELWHPLHPLNNKGSSVAAEGLWATQFASHSGCCLLRRGVRGVGAAVGRNFNFSDAHM